ncbi:lysine-specific demethylase JMJ21 isoform X2 [Malania oleifera]|uniref:lysine-specific demethylase JMJ21 isoform X2 n=1 Tax=Malania oleifera TaxID=397392 RepID=UPI0025AE47C5|nr:lysine-specific demethylase JMJ21 isoform X2 [Malania oleifera]
MTSMEVSQAQTIGLRDRRPEALGDLRDLPDELICFILGHLSSRDVARLSCVSSVMYILCNEEPLWMSLCVNNVKGQLQYKGSWKKTVLQQDHLLNEYEDSGRKPLQFDGFNSLFLYRRLYRCHVSLDGFTFDNGNVERKNNLSFEEFNHEYDRKKPVLLSGLAHTWPARSTWTTDQLLLKYGKTAFKISQKSAQKITMKFKDYVSYMELQHDEDPLYIFDEKFGEAEPGLLNDYTVPYLFQEDLFDVLDRDERPPFRWLIIGPERSGASWHVDPALTSAWNTLLCGRKRWALYPPGRVPLGVTVHVNEDDGDVNIETPSSLQWWLDFYPLLSDEDKPIECTQLPGVCRAGLLALDKDSIEKARKNTHNHENDLSYPELTRKEKRLRISKCEEDSNRENGTGGTLKCHKLWNQEFSYDINFLSMFLDKERDHYNSTWSSSNCIGQREMRGWLCKLWAGKPHMRELIWKGACLALNANKWLESAAEICVFHNLPSPADDERLPVGTGSNPVFLTADHVIKIYVEGGLEASLYGLGTELEFYSLLSKVNSPLKNHIPNILAHGFVFLENGSYKIVPWEGKGVPDVIAECNFILEKCREDGFPFGVWSKKQYEYRRAVSICESESSAGCKRIWPYIITKRCNGKIFAQLRDTISCEDVLSLASFLGEQLRNLHLLPCPTLTDLISFDQKLDFPFANNCMEGITDKVGIPAEWKIFIRTLNRKKKFVTSRLAKWGDPIPSTLIEKVHEYLPDDFVNLLNISEDGNGLHEVTRPCSWIHSDIMDDNINLEPCWLSPGSIGTAPEAEPMNSGFFNGHSSRKEGNTWRPSHILDFSDMSIGDPLFDLIPIHLDVFRGDIHLLRQLLESYKLPLVRTISQHTSMEGDNKSGRLSYHAMCYCIIHEENILGAIFSLWKELRMAESWEQVEETVWGELNNYSGYC